MLYWSTPDPGLCQYQRMSGVACTDPTVHTHSLGQRSFSYAATAVWNTLPYEIRSSNTISPLNHHLKLIFFSSPTDVCVCVGGGEERKRERELEVYHKM